MANVYFDNLIQGWSTFRNHSSLTSTTSILVTYRFLKFPRITMNINWLLRLLTYVKVFPFWRYRLVLFFNFIFQSCGIYILTFTYIQFNTKKWEKKDKTKTKRAIKKEIQVSKIIFLTEMGKAGMSCE